MCGYGAYVFLQCDLLAAAVDGRQQLAYFGAVGSPNFAVFTIESNRPIIV